MRIARNILLLILALLLQTSWVDKISILGVRPDLILLVLVYIGITGGQIEATLFGFASGFLVDVYDPQRMGINALTNSIVGFAVGYGRIGVVAEDVQVQVLLVFLAGILHDFIYFTVYYFSDPSSIFASMIHQGLGTAAYTAGVGACLSLLLSIRFDKGIHLDARRLHG